MYRQQRNYENLNKAIFEGAGVYGIPILHKDDARADLFVGFNYAKSCKNPSDKALHFFVDDYQFMRIWTNPDAYVQLLSRFSGNDLPARFNAKFGNETSFEKSLEAFRNAHVNDEFESGVTIDANGFITRYVHGTAGAVQIAGGKGEHVFHNHPAAGWPQFSGADLIATAMEPSAGIVASSTRTGRTPETAKYAGDYIFTKGQHFNPEAFVRGVKGAYLKGKDYNDAVDKWLKDHQKKYGYTYTYTPEKAKAVAKGGTKPTGSKKVKPVPDPNVYGVQLSFFD